MSIPLQITGKDFETIFLVACNRLPNVLAVRYGTKSVKVTDEELTKLARRPVFKVLEVPSLPDCDIAVGPAPARKVVAELKVMGAGTFPVRKENIKVSQVSYMLDAAAVGVPCWLVVHWTERVSAASGKSLAPAFTVALPVGDAFHPRWRNFVNAAAVAKKYRKDPQPQPSISREESLEQGTRINWIVPPGCRNAVPDLAGLLGVEPAGGQELAF